MANFFQIPLANSSRWVQHNAPRDGRYNTLSFDNKLDSKFYTLKRQRGGVYDPLQPAVDPDIEPIQLLSDFVPTLKYYDCNGKFITNIALNPIANGILNQTFICYQASVDWSLFAAGRYYGEISYTDQNNVVQYWQTCGIDVAIYWPSTVLVEYTNNQNDKGIIFETNIVFNIRLEGLMDEYQPKSLRTQYEDQKQDGRLLNGIPYRNFNFIIGIGISFPDWIIDKMNVIFTLSSVSVDGTYYIATDGTEFKLTRPSNQKIKDAYASLEVQSVPNSIGDKYTLGTTPTGDLIVIKQQKTYENVGGSFNVPGIFGDNTNLIRIAIWNYGLTMFDMLIGTTPGGNDIAEFTGIGTPNSDTSVDLTNSEDIGHVFNDAETVYITIPNGVNLKITLDYNKYDAPVLNPVTPGVGGFTKGQGGMYKAIASTGVTALQQLAIDWNVATGMGQAGTPWEKCQIADEFNGKTFYGWDRTTLATLLGTEIGANEITLDMGNLPNEGIGMFTTDVNPTAGNLPTRSQYVARARSSANQALNYEIVEGTTPAWLGSTEPLGDGDPFDNTPDSIITLIFFCISD